MDLPTAQATQQELVSEGIRADLRTISEGSVEGGVPAEYVVTIDAPGLTLAQLEIVVRVAKERSSDFGIDGARMTMI
jgi:hypothetical protein